MTVIQTETWYTITIEELLQDENLNPMVRKELMKPPTGKLHKGLRRNSNHWVAGFDERRAKKTGECVICGEKYTGFILMRVGCRGTCSEKCRRRLTINERKRDLQASKDRKENRNLG